MYFQQLAHCTMSLQAGEVVQSRLTAPTMDTGHPRALKHLLWQKPQPCREGTPHTLDNELQTDPDKHNSSWKGILNLHGLPVHSQGHSKELPLGFAPLPPAQLLCCQLLQVPAVGQGDKRPW